MKQRLVYSWSLFAIASRALSKISQTYYLFIYFIYTYNNVHTITVAINVEVAMTMKENTMDRRRRG